jgi:hypothetical protein
MNLNTIQLSPQLLAGLYSETLLETVATTVPEKKRWNYLGSNDKRILIVVSHLSVPFLPDDELNFLTSILAACKLSMGDVAIINFQKTDNSELPDLIDQESKTVLLLGIGPAAIGLPINFPPFQLQSFNKRVYLHAPSLSEIEKDKKLKKQLWDSLKKLFDL